jgi:hypothetical protein
MQQLAILLVYRGLELGVQSADVSALPSALSVKHVSSLLAKSPDHRGQEVCGCVLVAILESQEYRIFKPVEITIRRG